MLSTTTGFGLVFFVHALVVSRVVEVGDPALLYARPRR
jgi:hypothetical protein